ncbi:serine hydrolase [Allosaccharopolyspora coralli]|uniref:Serine hydrolase n=1 Tax=Allosaccharopolyspora coralli TaxID=2665642 RepID=A0A5Q3Q6T0_9PSEU|nr:serine hydrolase domain-containing protein [Allosaccharopolyspora coralli]QGK69136.1 serine hydrolase [Allosaccharopolyspora coralli]
MSLRGRSSRRLATGIAAALSVFTLGAFATPQPPALADDTSGDRALIETTRPLLMGTKDRVSVAMIENGRVRTAHFGADDDTAYEIGSITKVLTSHLLADAVERGEVTLDTRVGALVPTLSDTPVGDVTLAELASHRSGLPRLAPGIGAWANSYAASMLHRDPYTATADEVVERAGAARLDGRGDYRYSNFGAALLGQVLARATGTDYEHLLRERLFDVVGMPRSTVPLTPDGLPDDALTGYTEGGYPAEPWTLSGHSPAGGVRSTVDDMARFALTVLEGSAPGMDAVHPRWNDGASTDVGLAWHVSERDGSRVTWHNGATGGFSSIMTLDRERGRGVVVLSNTAADIDEVGFALLKGLSP